MSFIKAISEIELEEGKPLKVILGGEEIAIFKEKGNIYATSDKCAHKGGPLSKGKLSDFVITCPWHGMRYDIRTGQAAPDAWNSSFSIKRFNTKTENGFVFVDI